MPVPETPHVSGQSSIVVSIEQLPGAGHRLELRCAHCGRVLHPAATLFVVRLQVKENGDLRGTVMRSDGELLFSFNSGPQLAKLVARYAHVGGCH